MTKSAIRHQIRGRLFDLSSNRLLRSKKAADFFMIGLVITVIIVLLTMGIQIVLTQQKFRDIGQVQTELIKTFNEGEKALTYVDITSRLGAQQAIYNTAKDGGYYHSLEEGAALSTRDPCGKYKGYSLWFNKKNCVPERGVVESTLKDYLTNEIALALEPYPNVDLVSTEYIYNIIYHPEALTIIANSISKIALPMFKEQGATEYGSILSNFEKSPNYNKGRNLVIDTIVIHYTAGFPAQHAIDRFRDRNSFSSAHYIVDRDGTVIQVVKEEDRAWHAGCYLKGTCPVNCGLFPGYKDRFCAECLDNKLEGINEHSIGIEISNAGCVINKNFIPFNDDTYDCKDDPKTCAVAGGCSCVNGKTCWEKYNDVQMNALIELTAKIANKWKIPVDKQHIIGHEEITGCKIDPGPAFLWGYFIDEVKKRVNTA